MDGLSTCSGAGFEDQWKGQGGWPASRGEPEARRGRKAGAYQVVFLVALTRMTGKTGKWRPLDPTADLAADFKPPLLIKADNGLGVVPFAVEGTVAGPPGFAAAHGDQTNPGTWKDGAGAIQNGQQGAGGGERVPKDGQVVVIHLAENEDYPWSVG